MSFQYEINAKLGSADQVGLRLLCNSQTQAEEIHREIRQAGFKVTRLMSSIDENYTHFIYLNATEDHVSSAMLQINANILALNNVNSVKKEPSIKDFKTWQNLFRKAIKQLNSDYQNPISSVQEINQNILEQKITAGRITEVENYLLRQADVNDSNALRTLIALYAKTEQHEQLVELCKAKYSNILALPVSGRLVEQLVTAHLQYYQQTKKQELLGSVQALAQEFLPELERLRQANGVRKLLQLPLVSQENPPKIEGATLNEQLAGLLEIEPGERIAQLEKLKQNYPKAINVILILADSYISINNTEDALKIYQSIPEQTEEVKQRYAELLLNTYRFQEVTELLPSVISELSPALSGLRGAALYNLGQQNQASEFLEKAWEGGERSVQILLPLAKLWATVGDPVKAGEVYQILLETSNEKLTLEDRALIARVANLDGFGNIDDEQKLSYYEECVNLAGVRLLDLPEAEEILKDRLDLWKKLLNTQGIIKAYADWLDWLANKEKWESLNKELDILRNFAFQQKISSLQYFELLEGLEGYINLQPTLRPTLANDYFGLAIAEIDNALRQGEAEASFFQDLKLALFCLNSDFANDLVKYRQQLRADASKLDVQVALDENTVSTTQNLASIRLALVGGHQATRREIIRELCENYGLQNYIEVAPSSEAYISRSNVQAQISNCNLIAVITGYMGHDLSQIISDLKKDGALTGEVFFLACRGKSGVVRAILNKVQQNG
ncbi:hypothetical protein B6N60_04604 [Richelia sinica FACHB-800]|uniref:DUF2325 domain-containing protein n=1 Tax=Richelia sinica FACHB-800 TaxID=1357546 RepID=A0A975TC54_9NOST|nr:hypothetical protein [Richelia sinica]MBD2665157.1 hypothetical protein [Richelia sinica FACHB-800]QXE25884.1 hypothetical protein B6N60_04604 [Richelia sinica FACHB-800]